MNLHNGGRLSFGKDAETNKWEKNRVFNKRCPHDWVSTRNAMKLDPYLTSYR